MTIRVLVTDTDLGDPALEIGMLRESLGAIVEVRQCRTEADVITAVQEVAPNAMIVQWAPVSEAVLAAAPDLRVISRYGIGVDMIDVAAADARGIKVLNVPHYCLEEVATHAVALGLSLWRHLPELDRELRDGIWDAAAHASAIRRLSNSTIGLIGLGRIGRRVADAFAPWGGRVIVHDPIRGDDPYERVSLERIAAESDLISLHIPLLDSTHHLVDAAFLASCERRPYIVNVSRGALIDTEALAVALVDGQVAGAGIDVFESEPLPADHPLRSAPSTVLTPHAAWCSADALPALRAGAVQNVIDELG